MGGVSEWRRDYKAFVVAVAKNEVRTHDWVRDKDGAHKKARATEHGAPGRSTATLEEVAPDAGRRSRVLPAAPRSSIPLCHWSTHTRQEWIPIRSSIDQPLRPRAYAGADAHMWSETRRLAQNSGTRFPNYRSHQTCPPAGLFLSFWNQPPREKSTYRGGLCFVF